MKLTKNKTNIFIYLTTAFLILTLILTNINEINLIYTPEEKKIFSDDLKPSDINSLNYGTRYGPDSIDPHCAVDPWSFNVIEQVVETLFLPYQFH